MQFGIKPEDSIVIKGVTWTKFVVMTYLEVDDKFLERSINLIHGEQDADEQSDFSTNKDNGRGFNRSDAYKLSMYAEYSKTRSGLDEGNRLTPLERVDARDRMKKYAGQIFKLIVRKHKKEQEMYVFAKVTLDVNPSSLILGKNHECFYIVLSHPVIAGRSLYYMDTKALSSRDTPLKIEDSNKAMYLHKVQIISTNPFDFITREYFSEGALFKIPKDNIDDSGTPTNQ